MITTHLDFEADAFAARFAPDGTVVDHTREVAPGVMVDFDAHGTAIGIEVLSIRRRLSGHYVAASGADV